MDPHRRYSLKPTTNCHRKFQNRLCAQKGQWVVSDVSIRNTKGTLNEKNPVSNKVTQKVQWKQICEEKRTIEERTTDLIRSNKKSENWMTYEYYIDGHIQRFTSNCGTKIDKANSSEYKYHHFPLWVNRCQHKLSSNTPNDQWEYPDLTWDKPQHPVCIRLNDCIQHLWILWKWIDYFQFISSALHRVFSYICLSFVSFLHTLGGKAPSYMSKCVQYMQQREAVFYLQFDYIYNVLHQDITHHIEKAITYLMSKTLHIAIWMVHLSGNQIQVWYYFVDIKIPTT